MQILYVSRAIIFIYISYENERLKISYLWLKYVFHTYESLFYMTTSLNKNDNHYVLTHYDAENLGWEFCPHKDLG